MVVLRSPNCVCFNDSVGHRSGEGALKESQVQVGSDETSCFAVSFISLVCAC